MYEKNLNFGFNQDLNQLKDTVSRFARNEIAPLAKKIDENNEFPNFLWKNQFYLFLSQLYKYQNINQSLYI